MPESMEEVYKQECECLRREVIEATKEVVRLQSMLLVKGYDPRSGELSLGMTQRRSQ